MTFHTVVFLLVFFLLLSLALLWRLGWLPLLPSPSTARRRSPVHRLLKPRTPLDCPSCRLASTPSPSVRPACAPVRPWSEVKSRWGAPKHVNTAGFACPNQQCQYFGITEAHIHALVGDGKRGQTEQIQTFRCQACCTTFSARRNTPLYRLKTPSQQVAVVLSALAGHRPPVRKFFPSSIWAPARKTLRIASSTLYDISWPPFCLPLFTSDGLNVYFYALTAHFGTWRQERNRGRNVRHWQVAAGLIYGQVKKCYRRRKLVRVSHVMRLGTEEALKAALQGLSVKEKETLCIFAFLACQQPR